MKIERPNNKITEKEWIQIVHSHPSIISIDEFENIDKKIYDYAILRIGKKVYGRLLWEWDKKRIKVEIKKSNLKSTYAELLDIADALKANLYVKTGEKFNKKLHLVKHRIKLQRIFSYNPGYGLKNRRWITISHNDNNVVTEFLMLDKFGTIKQHFENGEIPGVCQIQGLVFIVFDKVPNILIDTKRDLNFTDQLSFICSILCKLSNKFGEVTYFEHNNKTDYTGFAMAINGDLIYAFWQIENFKFESGKRPKEFTLIDVKNAHEASSIWSIGVEDLDHIKELWV